MEEGRVGPAFREEGLPCTVLGSARAAVGSPYLGASTPRASSSRLGQRVGRRAGLLEKTQLPRRHQQDTSRWGHETSWRQRCLLGVTWEAEGSEWRPCSSSPSGRRRLLWARAAVGVWGDWSDRSQGRPVPRVLIFLTSDYAILKPPPFGGPESLLDTFYPPSSRPGLENRRISP